MKPPKPNITVDVCPGTGGKWSACIMDGGGEVLDAVCDVELMTAIGVATQWAMRHGTTYRVVDSPTDASRN